MSSNFSRCAAMDIILYGFWAARHSTITANIQLKKRGTGRESQGTWRQDELIDGKPPVVK
jgi:hypothetical protein